MKLPLAILFFSSALLAQVDSIFTNDQIYTGQIVSAMPYSLFLSNDTDKQKAISIFEIKRLVLRNGEVVVGAGVPPKAYSSYVRTFNSMQQAQMDSLEERIYTFQSLSDTTKATLDTAERSAIALERIAVVLSIQLGLGVALILMGLLAFL